MTPATHRPEHAKLVALLDQHEARLAEPEPATTFVCALCRQRMTLDDEACVFGRKLVHSGCVPGEVVS